MLSKFKKQINYLFRRRSSGLIDPDEIFLDSKNLPEFNKNQFEGRIEHAISLRPFIIFSVICFFLAIFLVYTLWSLSIRDGRVYAEISENNSLEHTPLIASRCIIYDRNGVPLAWNSPEDNGGVSASSTIDFPARKYIERAGFSHLLGFIKYPAKDARGY